MGSCWPGCFRFLVCFLPSHRLQSGVVLLFPSQVGVPRQGELLARLQQLARRCPHKKSAAAAAQALAGIINKAKQGLRSPTSFLHLQSRPKLCGILLQNEVPLPSIVFHMETNVLWAKFPPPPPLSPLPPPPSPLPPPPSPMRRCS